MCCLLSVKIAIQSVEYYTQRKPIIYEYCVKFFLFPRIETVDRKF